MVNRLTQDGHEWNAEAGADGIRVNGSGPYSVSDTGGGRFSVSGPDGTIEAITGAVGDTVWVGIAGEALAFEVSTADARAGSTSHDQDAFMPPMSATVIRIQTKPGAHVDAGDTLIVLEAMKMELPIKAPRAGEVRAVHCSEGQLVHPGICLLYTSPSPRDS